MPALMASPTGVVKVVSVGLELITVVAMPLAFAAMAVFMYDTISVGSEVAEPPHFGVGSPSSAAASFLPKIVGTKNGFVVTWLTNQNSQAGTFGKFPARFLAALAGVLDDPQAVSRAEAAAVALNRPVPASSLRRVGPSFMLSVSTASSTFGSTFLIAILQKSSVRQGSAPRGAYDPGPTWRSAPASSPGGRPGKRLSRTVRAPHSSRWVPGHGSRSETPGVAPSCTARPAPGAAEASPVPVFRLAAAASPCRWLCRSLNC